MNRFQNKLVMGGSDIESESEHEYMTGQEMYDLYMYNATMYNTMMHNMMPCIPMPCVPPYGYLVPYPSMLPNYPVNHAMAAGRYFEKGGRLRKNRRKVKSKEDDAKYYSHHRKHRAVVSRHRYYPSSSESDREDERPDTRAKRVPACRSVSHEIIADKSSHTLSHMNPVQSRSGVKPKTPSHKMPRMDFTPPSTPLHSHMVKSVQKISADIAADMPVSQVSCNTADNSNNQTDITERASPENECHVRAGSAAVIQKLPLYHPSIQNSVMAVNTCQQEEPTLTCTNDGDVDIFAANDTVPLKHVAPNDVTKSTDVIPSIDTSTLSASCESQTLDSNSRTATQIEVTSAFHFTSADTTQTLLRMTSYAQSQSIIVEGGGQLAHSTAQNDNNVDVGITKPSLQSSSNMAVLMNPVNGNSTTSVRPSNPDMDPFWRDANNSLKFLQSLHSLRKTWLERETKYRPPPVSIYTGRGAGP